MFNHQLRRIQSGSGRTEFVERHDSAQKYRVEFVTETLIGCPSDLRRVEESMLICGTRAQPQLTIS
jgi:hypothetical protein